MLDAKYVREHADEIRETISRQKNPERAKALDQFLKRDEEWRKLKQETDRLRSQRNKVSEDINKAKKEGKDPKQLLEEAKSIPANIKRLEEQMGGLDLLSLLTKIPNVMHPDVPYGKDESENREVKKWGKQRTFDFPVRNHVELCESLGIADFEASARTSGNGFYYLKGDLGLLNQALIKFALDTMLRKGYEYVEPPLLVRKEILDAAMDTASFEQSIYRTDHEDLALIGTAEHAILGLHEKQIFKEGDLPKKYFGYSMCFRKEIGSHGINEKGLWRTHQFNKVEQFVFCLPDQSWELYDELLANSEEILQKLQLPYRIVEMCTGDLALWKARSHDVEVWRPTTKRYGEVMSLSNCTTYQSTNLDIRYVRKSGERGFVHTLNNTALATSRIMVAILENCQEKDGSVTVPTALWPYLGKERISNGA